MAEQAELPPTIFVLYGATGDLARRMVLPAFYTLAIHGLLPSDWRLIGNGRGDVSHEDFKQRVHDALSEFGPKPEDGPWDDFSARLLFAGGGFNQDDPGSLLEVLDHAKGELGGDPQHVHYLAIPPKTFEDLTRAIGAHDLARGSRVVYEKPYGTSPASFRELDDLVHTVFQEDQVFRIDHFLGKEGTQNLHVMRFANRLFAGVWHRDHVQAVQIDVPETLDVADRAGFYDATGAARDMIVTHLFQVAAEVAMEPPVSLDAADLMTAREAVISAFRPLAEEDLVFGQFEGYRDIEGVADGSTTETFLAARLWIDTDRWHGVPFLLRTGKRMAVSAQQVTLVLRPPEGPFTHLPEEGNALTLSIAGSGELGVTMVIKKPGPDTTLTTGEALLPLSEVAGGDPLPPYVALIHDVLLGDRSLFTSTEGLAQTWRAAGAMLDPHEPRPYAPGSWGPPEAAELAAPGRWLLGQ